MHSGGGMCAQGMGGMRARGTCIVGDMHAQGLDSGGHVCPGGGGHACLRVCIVGGHAYLGHG